MVKRGEKISSSVKVERLIEHKSRLENQDPDGHISAWKKWISLPEREKREIEKAWEEYYEKVKLTTIYSIFQEERISLSEGNFSRVKDLVEDVRRMKSDGLIPEIKTPTSIDPEVLQHSSWVRDWKALGKTIKDWTAYPGSDGMKDMFA